jgi:hypothetical protein
MSLTSRTGPSSLARQKIQHHIIAPMALPAITYRLGALDGNEEGAPAINNAAISFEKNT